MLSKYSQEYAAWMSDPMGYWKDAAKSIVWEKFPSVAFDPTAGVYGRWFPDGVTNTCYNAVDRHIEAGHGERTAIIYDSPVTNTKKRYSYTQLREEIVAIAAIMQNLGVTKGDTVLIYMPMVPEAIVAMLACARIGAIHSVVFGGFAAHELAVRINDARPKIIVSASCGIEPNRLVKYKPILDEAIEQAACKPKNCIILQREAHKCVLMDGRDLDYSDCALGGAAPGIFVDCEPMVATDPLYILYTSGTTGEPKGVVRDTGGHMVALKWTMEALYDVHPGEVFWAASDIGWVVGHSYIAYAPLLQGATTLIYEGKPVGTPDPGAFWRVIEEHDVVSLFTAPTALRAIRKDDPQGEFISRYNMRTLRSVFLAGERADPDTIAWAKGKLGVPVIDHWWQTETGWAIAANPLGLGMLPEKLGSPAMPMPGYNVQVLDDDANPAPHGELGNIVISLPLPPGNLPTLWNADERFKKSYLSRFPGFYETGDAGFIDEDDYLFIMARTDDVINVAGHRLSTGAMEEILLEHADVAECAVVGADDQLKGQLPIGLVVLNTRSKGKIDEISSELIGAVRGKIGAVAAFKTVLEVPHLPKTRSGKVLRGIVQKMVNGQDYKVPATIEDPNILGELAEMLAPVKR